MAKHINDGKGSVSKGIRTSCNKLVKQPAKPQVGNNNNAMREAMLSTKFTDSVRYSRMGNTIINVLQAPVKRTADEIKGWTAKLSFKTFKQLKEQGIVA